MDGAIGMMSRGKPARVDGNHGEIVAVLRDIGAKVESLAEVGRGVPDLLVIYRGKPHLLEIKDGKKPPSARRLTPEQRTWHAAAHARGYDVPIVTSADEAIIAITREPARHSWKGKA